MKKLLLILTVIFSLIGCKKEEEEPTPVPTVCAECQNQRNGKWLDPYCGTQNEVDGYLKTMDAIYYTLPPYPEQRHMYVCRYVTK
jgi:nitrous oxide reductase accessory protein NosL